MEWLLFIVAFVFFLLGAACLVLVVLGLPGGWILLALAGLIEYADRFYLPEGDRQSFEWWVLIACAVLLGIGELIEFLAGVAGAARGGASRRGMIGSLIGGIAGVFVFTPLFFFVPLVGALFGALLGTFVGAVVGEWSAEDARLKQTMRPAFGATVGRVVGTASKMGITIAIWLVLTICAFWP